MLANGSPFETLPITPRPPAFDRRRVSVSPVSNRSHVTPVSALIKAELYASALFWLGRLPPSDNG